jgi:hypothetical protein
MNGGTVTNFNFVGCVSDNSSTLDFDNEGSNSKYIININGGSVTGTFTTMMRFSKKAVVKNVDVEVNIGNGITYAKRFVAGPWSTSANVTVTNCNVTVNANNVTFGTEGVYGGYINVATTDADKVVFGVDLVYNIGETGKVTFNGPVRGGSYINTSATYSEHQGDVVINLWPCLKNAEGNVIFNGNVHAGSELRANYSKHTGDTKVILWNSPFNSYDGVSIDGGSRDLASDKSTTEHVGKAEKIVPTSEEIAEYIISKTCEVNGFSIRSKNLAMRCRVEMNDDFFANFFNADEVTAKAFGGFTVKKIGFLVSGTNDFSDSNTKVIDAVAWENNEIKATNGWATSGYSFAAAINGYKDADGNVIKDRAETTVYFKAYVDLVCGDDTIRVYIDNHTAPDADSIYEKSLYDVAKSLSTSGEQNVKDWLDADDGDGNKNSVTVNAIISAVESAAQQVMFNVADGSAWCDDATATYEKKNGDNLVYKLKFDVNKAGYVVSGFAGDMVKNYTKVEDNVFYVEVPDGTTEATINVTKYARKTSTELEARRTKVLDKMKQITGVQYTVDKQYSFIHGSNTITLVPGVVYQGMPYSDNAPFSPDAFMDFKTTTNANGVHTMSFTVNNPNFFPGNSCADAVFWSWGTVSSTIKFFSSYDMIEDKGVYTVGDFDVQASDISNGVWVNTADVCTRNGLDVMSNAYAFMVKGDAMQRITPNLGNHTILVGDVVVKYKADGKTINPDASYILYYDQHGGYNTTPQAGLNGQNVITCCRYNEKKYFSELYTEGYLPVTCIELLEDAPLADIVFTDTEETLNFSTVTNGMIETNYALSKIEMVITNKATNETYKAVRHGYDSPRLKFYFASFNNNNGNSGEVENVYNDAILRFNLPSGDYTCVVTGYFSNGETEVIRNYEFTRP